MFPAGFEIFPFDRDVFVVGAKTADEQPFGQIGQAQSRSILEHQFVWSSTMMGQLGKLRSREHGPDFPMKTLLDRFEKLEGVVGRREGHGHVAERGKQVLAKLQQQVSRLVAGLPADFSQGLHQFGGGIFSAVDILAPRRQLAPAERGIYCAAAEPIVGELEKLSKDEPQHRALILRWNQSKGRPSWPTGLSLTCLSAPLVRQRAKLRPQSGFGKVQDPACGLFPASGGQGAKQARNGLIPATRLG